MAAAAPGESNVCWKVFFRLSEALFESSAMLMMIFSELEIAFWTFSTSAEVPSCKWVFVSLSSKGLSTHLSYHFSLKTWLWRLKTAGTCASKDQEIPVQLSHCCVLRVEETLTGWNSTGVCSLHWLAGSEAQMIGLQRLDSRQQESSQEQNVNHRQQVFNRGNQQILLRLRL